MIAVTSLSEYRPLRRRDFALSSVALFGLIGRQKVALARKPVKRIFALKGRSARYLDLSFLTDAGEMARGAVEVVIRYLAAPGMRQARKIVRHNLFADPAGGGKSQRLWLVPPKGANFAEVSFSRAVRGATVAMDARLKLGRDAILPTLDDFDAVLASRDLSSMELLLGLLEEEGDAGKADTLLSRMRLLCNAHSLVVRHANIQDAQNILLYGPAYKVPGIAGFKGNGGRIKYCSRMLVMDLEKMPLSKALVADGLRLYRALLDARANILEIDNDADGLAALLVSSVLKQGRLDLTVRLNWEVFGEQPQKLGPWLSFRNGDAFLETQGGRIVRSVLDGKSA
ncbi:MAG: hypothetical protein HWE25_03360 [Alphaproteobacteria bacterium]|nr:hypothetical protein [Alphaproteobacteria bacterium]